MGAARFGSRATSRRTRSGTSASASGAASPRRAARGGRNLARRGRGDAPRPLPDARRRGRGRGGLRRGHPALDLRIAGLPRRRARTPAAISPTAVGSPPATGRKSHSSALSQPTSTKRASGDHASPASRPGLRVRTVERVRRERATTSEASAPRGATARTSSRGASRPPRRPGPPRSASVPAIRRPDCREDPRTRSRADDREAGAVGRPGERHRPEPL